MKNSAVRGGCYPTGLKAEMNNTNVDTRKIYQLSTEVIFFAPFQVCFSFFAFNLARR